MSLISTSAERMVVLTLFSCVASRNKRGRAAQIIDGLYPYTDYLATETTKPGNASRRRSAIASISSNETFSRPSAGVLRSIV